MHMPSKRVRETRMKAFKRVEAGQFDFPATLIDSKTFMRVSLPCSHMRQRRGSGARGRAGGGARAPGARLIRSVGRRGMCGGEPDLSQRICRPPQRVAGRGADGCRQAAPARLPRSLRPVARGVGVCGVGGRGCGRGGCGHGTPRPPRPRSVRAGVRVRQGDVRARLVKCKCMFRRIRYTLLPPLLLPLDTR